MLRPLLLILLDNFTDAARFNLGPGYYRPQRSVQSMPNLPQQRLSPRGQQSALHHSPPPPVRRSVSSSYPQGSPQQRAVQQVAMSSPRDHQVRPGWIRNPQSHRLTASPIATQPTRHGWTSSEYTLPQYTRWTKAVNPAGQMTRMQSPKNQIISPRTRRVSYDENESSVIESPLLPARSELVSVSPRNLEGARLRGSVPAENADGCGYGQDEWCFRKHDPSTSPKSLKSELLACPRNKLEAPGRWF